MTSTAAFFNSWPGMFLAQSFLHSLIAAIIVDTALIAWHIGEPGLRQRLRLIVILLPIAAFPCFQLLNQNRGSALFRLEAILDINRWLNLTIWGVLPVGTLFLLLLGFTAVLFVYQEMLPIIRHTRTSPRDIDVIGSDAQGPLSAVARARERIPAATPEVIVIDDADLLMFSTTGREPAIYLSRGLVDALSEEELRAAIAHEVGHVLRSRRPFMVLVFVLRVLMFYNPVILMEFRRIAQEEEKICDDLAVGLTGSRSALAGALRKVSASGEDPGAANNGASNLRDRLEEYSHTLLLESRISRLEETGRTEPPGAAVFAVVLMTLLAVSYYLV